MTGNKLAKGMGALAIFLGLIFVKTTKSFLLESCAATSNSAKMHTQTKPDTISNNPPQLDEISINIPTLRDAATENRKLNKNGEQSKTTQEWTNYP